MDTDNTTVDWSGRWKHVRKLLERSGPFAHPDFEGSPDILEFMLSTCKVLVIGAGGLGCEILKGLALSGFRNIDVIDMDTVDLSNLNRQFLFRLKDISRDKATVAAEFVNTRVPGCNVTPHFKKIQEYDQSFYRQFHIIICGLDSVIARRWINGMVLSLLNYEDGVVDPTTIIPMIDGGTEGFKGNARVILPGMTACIDCTLDLFPPQINFPMCTIAHTPRLPEHCIEYVKVLLWPQERPFGENVRIDGDNPTHIQWIFEKAQDRADQFNIKGVTYRLTQEKVTCGQQRSNLEDLVNRISQGVVKRIIPAVASTNAVVAAQCVTEAFKLASSCCNPLNNYMIFNDVDGVYTYTYEAERKDDCVACSQVPQALSFKKDAVLQDLVDHLKNSVSLQMREPGITATVNGKNKTLYMQSVEAIRKKTKENLTKRLSELGLTDGQELVVADVTTPNALIFKLKYEA